MLLKVIYQVYNNALYVYRVLYAFIFFKHLFYLDFPCVVMNHSSFQIETFCRAGLIIVRVIV